MAKKYSYHAELRQQMGSLIDQLELPNLHKQALKDRWLDQLIWADKKAAETRKWHYRLRLTTIIGGVLLPALVGISVQMKDNKDLQLWFPYLAFGLSQVIAVSAALEEFCRFGDRWRDYRQMSEDLKAEGWQYLQSSGPYSFRDPMLSSSTEELRSANPPATAARHFSDSLRGLRSRGTARSTQQSLTPSHLQSYAEFAGRIEAIIKNDVKSYVSSLEKRQAKQEAQVENILAQAMATEQTLNPLNPNQPQIPPGYAGPGQFPHPGYAANGYPGYPPAPNYPGMGYPPGYPPLPSTPAPLGYIAPSATIDQNGAAAASLLTATATFGAGMTVTAGAIAAPVAAAPKEIRLPVPYFSQRDNLEEPFRTCNTYSCGMVGKFLGARIANGEEYYQIVRQYGDTTSHEVQSQALASLGIQSQWMTTLDFADLDLALANGFPVVIGILHHGPLEAPSGDGHILVVTGRTATGDYVVNDPYGNLLDEYNTFNGNGLTYPRPVLERRWLMDGSKTGWGRLFQGNRSPIASIATAHAAPAAVSPGLQRLTAEQLIQIAGPDGHVDRLRQFTPDLNGIFERYQINTPLRMAHLLAQVMLESGAFQYVREIWGPTPDQESYETRGEGDLGNTQPGDGKRFLGRGLIQLTGRSNYAQFSQAIGVDCVSQPELVEQSPYAVLAAGWFWDSRQINPKADRDDLEAVTRAINGGTNGLPERAAFLQAAKSVLRC